MANRNKSSSDWSDEAEELWLYLDNDRELYEQKKLIASNLLKKISRGTYEHKLAPEAWGYVVERAAKKYVKEFDENEAWNVFFNASARKQVSRMLADKWLLNVKDGRPEEV